MTGPLAAAQAAVDGLIEAIRSGECKADRSWRVTMKSLFDRIDRLEGAHTERCPTEAEKKAQGERCGCDGQDD